MSFKKNQQGMTLFELVITILILGALVSMAVPNMRKMVLNSASIGASDSFGSALTLARTEAIKRRAMVALCPNPSSALGVCGSNWSNGWRVVLDNATSEGQSTVTAGDIVRVWDEPDKSMTISNADNISFVRFLPNGMLGKNATAPIQLGMYAKGCSGKNSVTLTIGLGGNISSVKSECPK